MELKIMNGIMNNQWFKSYLHSRKQRVFVNGVFSDTQYFYSFILFINFARGEKITK